jgi:hypothetical protein
MAETKKRHQKKSKEPKPTPEEALDEVADSLSALETALISDAKKAASGITIPPAAIAVGAGVLAAGVTVAFFVLRRSQATAPSEDAQPDDTEAAACMCDEARARLKETLTNVLAAGITRGLTALTTAAEAAPGEEIDQVGASTN